MDRIGMIGPGRMGLAMVKHMIKAGYAVTVTDIDERRIEDAEGLTGDNTGLHLVVAANYGGRWDIVQAVNKMIGQDPDKRASYTEEDLVPHLALSYAPEPDLFIRTGGEQRISNFLLWQLAYTEFFFTDELWPDFDSASLTRAFTSYRTRERRFGRTSEQVTGAQRQVESETPAR